MPVERMGGLIAGLSNAVFGRWALAGTGSLANINGRIADDPALARIDEYGRSFFDLGAARAAGILGILRRDPARPGMAYPAPGAAQIMARDE